MPAGAFLLLTTSSFPCYYPLMTDFILRGGMVYDGSGEEARREDIAVTDDTITALGDLSLETAGQVLDVTGLVVSPGFIDIHTHSDYSLLLNRPMRSSLTQGVTTELVGNCGVSVGLVTTDDVFTQERRWAERGGTVLDWSDMAGFLHRVEEGGIACNIATLAGHGTLRKAVLGFEDRPPTSSELARMQALLAAALADGAVGLSTGLEYLPGGYARHDEVATRWQPSRGTPEASMPPISAMKVTRWSKAFRRHSMSPRRRECHCSFPIINPKAVPIGASRKPPCR